MKQKVIIIGAGPGGLASAMLLARSGCDVTVLERQPRVGGRTSTVSLGDYRFDLGPTFFMYPRILEEIYRACGRDLWREVEMVRLDPNYHLIFEQGGQLKATSDVARMESQIAALNPSDSANLRAYLADNRDKLDTFRPILQRPFNSFRDVLAWPVLKALRKLRPLHSVDSDLRRYFSDPRVRLAFTFQSKYLGMSPFQCPSLFTILSFLEYEHGVWHPIGGCGSVTASMAGVCEDLGVKLHLGQPVRQVLFSGRRAVGVRTDEGEHLADAVVINADFAHAMRQMVPDALRRRWTDRKIDKKRFSCSTFMMYLGLDRPFDNLAHHTIWLAADYERQLRDIERDHVLSDNPCFYVQNPCRTDPTLAPRGHSALYVLVPVTHMTDGVDWSAEAPRFRQRVLNQLSRIGLSGIEPHIRAQRIITPADWQNHHAIHLGATFNLAHSLGQMLHRRPHNRFEDLQNVYLVGGGTHPGSGLPVIFESARISSRLLLEDLGMPVRWPGQTGEADRPAVASPLLEPVGA